MKIEFNHISKSWGEVSSLKEINFCIEDGEFVAILGPSGCGKSTTLMLMAGIYQSTAGEIYFDGHCVNQLAARERNLSVVFQSYALYPHKSVEDNILFPLQYLKPKLSVSDAKERMLKVAKKVQVEHLLARMPAELSGGQQQRVALARALIKEPGLLLLDEPLSNLDATLRHKMRDELIRLQKELHITCVMVTHDQIEATTMADKIICMNHGVIEQVGTPADIYHRPATKFVAEFVGSPAINIIGADKLELLMKMLALNKQQLGVTEDIDSAAIEIGIRPEALQITETGHVARIVGISGLGRELVLTLATLLGELVAVVGVREGEFNVGDELAFRLDVQQVHLFNTHTQQRIIPSAEQWEVDACV